jgi:hypothetical protein
LILEDEGTTCLGSVRSRSASHSESCPTHLNPQPPTIFLLDFHL